MSTSNVLDAITAILICIAMIAYYKLISNSWEKIKSKKSISAIATMDLSMLGTYDVTLQNVVSNWVYAVMVHAYLIDKSKTYKISDMFIQHVKSLETDNKDFIKNGVHNGIQRFADVLLEHEDSGMPIVFKVDTTYDYHVLPKSMLYNDYIDTDILLEKIDSIMEVARFED